MNKLRIAPPVKVLDQPLSSVAEFDKWKHSVYYNLRLDVDLRPYLSDDFVFGIKTKLKPQRNLKDIKDGKTAVEQCADVDFMLDTISQYCPNIPHNDISRDCQSLSEVWQVIRLHSNIQTSGALLNEVWNIVRLPTETPQALYSRIKQAYDDNLMRKDTIKYKEKALTVDEEMSPTLHCTVILHWLQVLHPKLRDVVTQRFCTELRNSSYAAIWPEISRSVDMFLKELAEDGTICRTERYEHPNSTQRSRGSYSRGRGRPYTRATNMQQSSKVCDYCRILGKRAAHTHVIDDCMFLKKERQSGPSGDSRALEVEEYDEHLSEFYEEYSMSESAQSGPSSLQKMTTHTINRVSVYTSPWITLYRNNKPYTLVVDTGGTCNAIDAVTAEEMHCDIRPSAQRAKLADGKTHLRVLGETSVNLMRMNKPLKFEALVCEMKEQSILAGIPFMVENDVSVRPARSEVTINGCDVVKYEQRQSTGNSSRRLTSYTVRSSVNRVVLPGEEATFDLPQYLSKEESVVVEPRFDSFNNKSVQKSWPQAKVEEVRAGSVVLSNTTSEPVILKKNEHLFNLQAVVPDDEVLGAVEEQHASCSMKKTAPYSAEVRVNPDGLMKEEDAARFRRLIEEYDEVFNPAISQYNGKSGAVFVQVNMGSQPPPQHKGHVPFYGRNNMVELQNKFDELTRQGVFKRPQDVGVNVEIINPSFLVKKKVGWRLVTDFAQLSGYCRPQPTLMPDCDTALKRMASWTRIIQADMSDAYYRLKLQQESQKYCGVVSPTKGVLVYTVGCMGLPGTEVALEELTCLLFGHLVHQGKAVKVADDLMFGADNDEELFKIFEEVLGILAENNVNLSARKTVIVPKEVTVLGWIWSGGFLKATPHKLSGLSECEPPATVKGLKSYLGAYRYLARVIKNYASLLLPLEGMVSGKIEGNTKIQWSSEKLQLFHKAQSALKDAKAIVLPRPDDVLQVVTDAAVLPTAVGAVLYAVRGNKTLLAGFYNAKLPTFQRKWLPCELEGVAIGAALNHFGPYIQHSNHRPQVLTDSKACVQAVEKLSRGEYSASARLGTFLSAVSRFQATVKHIKGTVNVTSDFISRNPVECHDKKCQICSFLRQSMESVVGAMSVESFLEQSIESVCSVSVSDIIEGRVRLPFVNKRAWIGVQEQCADLRKVDKFLRNGTKPGKKGHNFRLVKRYLSSRVVLSTEGVLVVRQVEPFSPTAERIVVPQQALYGLLAALHLKLSHPSALQLEKVFNRYFFALNLDKAIVSTSRTCHLCASLRDVPKALREESADEPPSHFAQKFAADVIKRNGQLILVLRETISSYTQAELVSNETVSEISAGLVRLSNLMRPSKLVPMTIRLDPHPSHRSMCVAVKKSEGLSTQNIDLEIGREHNVNHNPVAEKAVREVIRELLVLVPEGGKITSSILSDAIACLNSRLRASGVSAYEIFTQRDQSTGCQISLDDMKLIGDQQKRRVVNHKYSEKNKSHGKPPHPESVVVPGDIVYIYDDRSKLHARPRYIVISVAGSWCEVRRFADKMLGGRTYSIKLSECYKVPDEVAEEKLPCYSHADEDYELISVPVKSNTHNEGDEDSRSDDDNQVAAQAEYPCSECKEEVADEDPAIACNSCDKWCHTKCCAVDEAEYQRLQQEELEAWYCPSCTQEERPAGEPPDRS